MYYYVSCTLYNHSTTSPAQSTGRPAGRQRHLQAGRRVVDVRQDGLLAQCSDDWQALDTLRAAGRHDVHGTVLLLAQLLGHEAVLVELAGQNASEDRSQPVNLVAEGKVGGSVLLAMLGVNCHFR